MKSNINKFKLPWGCPNCNYDTFGKVLPLELGSGFLCEGYYFCHNCKTIVNLMTTSGKTHLF